MNERRGIAAALTGFIGLGALLAGCSREAPPPEPVRAVRTLAVAPESAGGSVEYAAEIRARVESRIGFRVAGKMVSREVEVGQRVAAGQVLARLDPVDLKLAENAARAAVAAARTQYELAASDLARSKDLNAKGFVSGAEIDRRQTELDAARAQLNQAQAQAGVQGNQAGYAALTATAAGIVTAVEAEPGAVLAAGTPVLRIAYDGPRDAVFAVPEDAVAPLRALQGQAGALRVRLWGDSQQGLAATVREVAAAADAATRTFQIKADVGSADVPLGRSATALLDLPRREGALKLPLAAVAQHEGRTVVWIVDKPSMTVKPQPVQLGGADGGSVVVAAGLAPGQRVVTAGVHALVPGQKVRLYEPAVAVK